MESELRKAAEALLANENRDTWAALKAVLSAPEAAQPTQAHRPEQDAAVEAVKLLLYERFGILADAQPATDQIIAAVRKADAK